MNADTLQTTLDGLTRMLVETQTLDDSDTLNDAWGLLRKHQMAMEAGEKPETPKLTPTVRTGCVGGPILMDLGELDARFATIEKRLDRHHERFCAIVSRVDCQTRSLDTHRKRLGKIERKVKHMDLLVSAVYSYLRELHPDFVPPSQPSESRVEATLTKAVSEYDELLKRLGDTTNRVAEDEFYADTPPVDWGRWHELLDKKSEPLGLTPAEEEEYLEFARITAQLDVKEGKAADAAMDDLAKKAERCSTPAPPVDVEMRVIPTTYGHKWEWRFGAEPWMAVVRRQRIYSATERAGRLHGEAWLAALSRLLGVPLKANWVEEPTSETPVDVEMRVGTGSMDDYPRQCECLLGGEWVEVREACTTDGVARTVGDQFLAALSEQLGRPLVAKWVDGE